MPRLKKLFVRDTAVFVSFRTEEGLPLVPTNYMQVILTGILARAQTLYPVKIVALVVMPNHLHMVLVVEHPASIPAFIGYFKKKSASAINKLLGREQHTVWQEGYDSPLILDYQELIRRLVYIYTNPQRANLVDKIDDYPNISSWNAFQNRGSQKTHKKISDSTLREIGTPPIGIEADRDLAKKLLTSANEENLLVIEPDAWIECFPDASEQGADFLRQYIERQVRLEEYRLRKERKKGVMGAFHLRTQAIDLAYTPTKRQPRMICLGSHQYQRARYIELYRLFEKEALRAYQSHLKKRRMLAYPPGMFAPGGLLQLELAIASISHIFAAKKKLN